MSNLTKVASVDLGILILRLSVGGLMLFHGIAKVLHGHDAIKGILAEHGLPEVLWIGIPLCELIAPVLMILGIFTRLSGLAIVLVMVSTLFLAFGWTTFSIGKYGGLMAELNLLFLGGGLSLIFTGGGKYVIHQSSNDMLN
ncbi:DoxX family protein [Pedobacter sp. GR22-6]|uniref:DoxX family protein n=1 Tax=Pedobacter sp. GR22-6 TaxID=3127957 RepID=UPI00307D690A